MAPSVPRTSVAPVESMPPVPWASASFAPSHLASAPASPRSWRTASTMRNMPRMPGWQAESPPPSVFVGSGPSKREPSALDERAALALRAEAEVLEREQHGDRERVVELQHVDVVEGHPGPLERQRAGLRRGRRRSDRPDCDDVQRGGSACAPRRARSTGALRQVTGPLLGRDDARAAAVGDDAAVEHVQRVGDHPRRRARRRP